MRALPTLLAASMFSLFSCFPYFLAFLIFLLEISSFFIIIVSFIVLALSVPDNNHVQRKLRIFVCFYFYLFILFTGVETQFSLSVTADPYRS